MDKTKLLAVLALALAGGAMVLSKAPEKPTTGVSGAASAAHDHDGDGKSDHGDEAHTETSTNTSTETASSTDVAGGVTKLKIEDLRKGDGPVAAPGDNLTMNYRGTLLSGKEFDASYGREPFQFQLGGGQVIKVGTKALKG
jgi:FKBP-type peptidyl-prolyl cis-trans isomerase